MELLVFVASGETEPEEHRFEDPGRIVLGRGPQSPIALDGSAVSREHLSLEVRGGALWATDVSSNGSYFNGRTLTPGAPQLVGPSDEVRVGDYTVRFRVVADEPEPPAPAPSERPVPPPPEPRSLAAGMLTGISFAEWLALGILVITCGFIAVWYLR